MIHFDMAMFQSHEFMVGAAVAGIMLCALFASSLFRNLALAFAAGGLVVLYVQGGVPNLVAMSKLLETEFRSIPDFATGLVVGSAVASVLLLSFRPRTSS